MGAREAWPASGFVLQGRRKFATDLDDIDSLSPGLLGFARGGVAGRWEGISLTLTSKLYYASFALS